MSQAAARNLEAQLGNEVVTTTGISQRVHSAEQRLINIAELANKIRGDTQRALDQLGAALGGSSRDNLRDGPQRTESPDNSRGLAPR